MPASNPSALLKEEHHVAIHLHVLCPALDPAAMDLKAIRKERFIAFLPAAARRSRKCRSSLAPAPAPGGGVSRARNAPSSSGLRIEA